MGWLGIYFLISTHIKIFCYVFYIDSSLIALWLNKIIPCKFQPFQSL